VVENDVVGPEASAGDHERYVLPLVVGRGQELL